MQARLYHFDGSEAAAPSPINDLIPPLRRHRMLFESVPAHAAGPSESHYKVFEHVRGARIVGRAPPETEVRLMLPLQTNRGRRFAYMARTISGPGSALFSAT